MSDIKAKPVCPQCSRAQRPNPHRITPMGPSFRCRCGAEWGPGAKFVKGSLRKGKAKAKETEATAAAETAKKISG